MNPVRWESLKELYERASDLAPKDRASFLQQVRADDPETAADLESLLTASDEAVPFFDSLADRVLSHPPWLAELQEGDRDAPDPMIGRSIRHYEIEEELGRGGMGVVYRARDTRLDRTIALKFLPPHRGEDEAAIKRFLVEARAAAALDHLNICAIHEIAEDDKGRLFIAMAFYEGETLSERLKQGPVPIEDALDYTRQIAAGLEAAHGNGIIHRDIKPGNVIVTRDGVAKILDFGLAKLSDVTLTGTRMTMGTLGYMPPEQATGGSVDHRADLWSLGVVLYEMLTGERPFKGDNAAAAVHAIVNREPEPVRSLRPDVPPEVEVLLLRLLEKDPALRIESARALLVALEGPESVTAVRVRGVVKVPGAPESLWTRLRRRPLVAALGLLGVAVAVLLGLWQIRTSTGASAGQDKSVAVLPFENLSEDPATSVFSDGVQSEVINHLAKVADLTVITRTSVKQYRDTEKSLREIARELGVATIVEGDVLRIGDRVRVNAYLVRAEPEQQLWADQYDRQVEDVFEIQSDIAQRIAAALQASLTPAVIEEIERRPTDNLEAYGYYLRAAEVDERSQQKDLYHELLALLERAVELDPEFAEAWALLSEYHSGLYFYEWDRTPDRLAMAETAARTALELQPGLGEGHRALGFYYYWGLMDWDRALDHFALALATLPSDSHLRAGFGYVQRRAGLWDESLESLTEALTLDPGSSQQHYQVASTLTLLRRYAEAEPYFNRAIRLKPEDPQNYTSKAWLHLLWTGDTRAADAALHELYARRESIDVLDVVEMKHPFVALLDRRYTDALDILAASPADVYESQFYFIPKAQLYAQVYGLTGQPDRAAVYYDSARMVIDDALRDNPDDERLHGALGLAYAGLGRRGDAVREAELGVELMPVEREAWKGAWRVEELARVYTMVGEYDAAIDRLDYMLSMPSEISVPLLRIDPTWDPLRDHPSFQALLENYDPEGASQ